MSQRYRNLLDMYTNDLEWANDWSLNVNVLKDIFRTFNIALTVAGSHTSPSTVSISLQDAVGNNISEQFFLRVRLANAGSYLAATNATMAPGSGATVVQTITSGKDLIFQSNSSGVLQIICTDATIEHFLVLIGQAFVTSPFVNYNNSLDISHA